MNLDEIERKTREICSHGEEWGWGSPSSQFAVEAMRIVVRDALDGVWESMTAMANANMEILADLEMEMQLK